MIIKQMVQRVNNISVIDVIIVSLIVYGILAVARGQQPAGPQVIRMNMEQQLVMQNILQQQENLRLQICISQDPPVPATECGQLTPTGVMRNPKPAPVGAAQPPKEEKAPPVKQADANAKK